jgi:subtilisin inhibitor-like
MTRRSRLAGSWSRNRNLLSRGVLLAACGIVVAACGSIAAPGAGHSGGPAVTAPSGTGAASGSGSATPGSGSPGTGTPGTGTGAGTATTVSSAKVSITVVLSGDADQGVAQRWTLACNPTGGTYPHAATACARLLKLKDIFSPQPAHVMCPMIMANARGYLVSGTFFGRPVHETIMDGGCSLTRWTELHHVFS